MSKTDEMKKVEDRQLSETDELVYARLAAREHVHPCDRPSVDRLREHHLVETDPHSPNTPLVLDPREAERRSIARIHGEIIDKLTDLRAQTEAYGRLEGTYAQQRHAEGGVRLLDTAPLANAAIGQAMAKLSTALYTAQPTQRTPEVLASSMQRDGKLLRRGIRMYTIYPQSARSRDLESHWAEEMSALGAEIRTSPVPFPRIIFVDGVSAYVEEPLPEGEVPTDPPSPRPAIEVAHPALLAWVKSIYTFYWNLSQPWQGGSGRAVAQESTTVTTRRQRTILRLLASEAPRAQIARELFVSERIISSELKDLREKLGAETDFGLALRWRDHPEYTLP